MTFACAVCGTTFARATQLKTHEERKRPCKPPQLLQQEFRATSVKFHGALTKEARQATGIFFTPKKVRDILFERLAELGVAPTRILEPSFGSGEFLLDARERWPTARLFGVELNKALFMDVAALFKQSTGFSLTNADFLTWAGEVDLVLGNPPYFVLPPSSDHPMCTGRPNIYISFLHKCLSQHLRAGGFLAFIIPTSIYNCAYYQPMRDYIAANTVIRHVETLVAPGFHDTAQEVALLILQKMAPPPNPEYFFRSSLGTLYISPQYKELYELTAGSTTVKALGLAVKTGNVVWNQVKDKLTADATKGTLLIYASNIKGSVLALDNLLGDEKKQYVKDLKKPTLDGPVILVERGYGNVVSFHSVLVDKKGFYAENHLNVIYPVTGTAADLARVHASLKSEKTARFITLFNGNGTISATDLETLVPIF